MDGKGGPWSLSAISVKTVSRMSMTLGRSEVVVNTTFSS
jgi:hypothetical protein